MSAYGRKNNKSYVPKVSTRNTSPCPSSNDDFASWNNVKCPAPKVTPSNIPHMSSPNIPPVDVFFDIPEEQKNPSKVPPVPHPRIPKDHPFGQPLSTTELQCIRDSPAIGHAIAVIIDRLNFILVESAHLVPGKISATFYRKQSVSSIDDPNLKRVIETYWINIVSNVSEIFARMSKYTVSYNDDAVVVCTTLQ